MSGEADHHLFATQLDRVENMINDADVAVSHHFTMADIYALHAVLVSREELLTACKEAFSALDDRFQESAKAKLGATITKTEGWPWRTK